MCGCPVFRWKLRVFVFVCCALVICIYTRYSCTRAISPKRCRAGYIQLSRLHSFLYARQRVLLSLLGHSLHRMDGVCVLCVCVTEMERACEREHCSCMRATLSMPDCVCSKIGGPARTIFHVRIAQNMMSGDSHGVGITDCNDILVCRTYK